MNLTQLTNNELRSINGGDAEPEYIMILGHKIYLGTPPHND